MGTILDLDEPSDLVLKLHGGNEINRVNKLFKGINLTTEDGSDVSINTNWYYYNNKLKFIDTATGKILTIAIPSLAADRTVTLPASSGQLSLSAMGLGPVNWGANLQEFRSSFIKLKDADDSHGILLKTDPLSANWELLFQTPGHATDDYVIYSKKASQELKDKIFTNPTLSAITFNVDSNILKHSTTNAAGDLLMNDATKYQRVPRGTNGQVFTATSTSAGWADPPSGGGGATSGGDYAVPHVGNIITGGWDGTTTWTGTGTWNGALTNISSGATLSTITDGTGIIGVSGSIPAAAGNVMGFRTFSDYLSPLNDPYFWVRYKIGAFGNTNYRLYIGLVNPVSASWTVSTQLNTRNGLTWFHGNGNANISPYRNDGDATGYTEIATPILSATDANIHTIAIFYESANTRFGMSLDGGAVTYFTTQIPLSNSRLGCLISFENISTITKNFYLYGAYCKTKVI